MGLESYLLNITFKKPVPQAAITDIIASAGAVFLPEKSNTAEPIDSFRNFYFEIRSDLGLTELYILLAPGKNVVSSMSLRFSILSPSTVIDQTFAFLQQLNKASSVKVLDTENNSKELSLNVDEFKLNKKNVRKLEIVMRNKTGLIIEGGQPSNIYIFEKGFMDKIWRQY